MTDIVRVEGEYYVRASSALADDRTRVLKYGDTFAIFNRYGDIEAFGPSQFGLFHAESRYLSCFTMRVNQRQPLLLSSTIHEDNAFLSVDLTNLDSPVNSDDTLPRGTVHIFRLQFLREASCYQHIRLLNYDRQPVRVSLFLQFDADFADIFEVRGTKRARKGERLPDQVVGDAAILADTARRSCSIAANFSAWLLQRKALPSPRYKRIIVIDTRGSQAALSGNVPFVIEVA